MKRNKVGSIFLVSMLALACLGISYAGFTDSLSVHDTVNTANVEIEYTEGLNYYYYKNLDTGGIEVYNVFLDVTLPEYDHLFWTGAYTDVIAGTAPYDVDITWHGIFPCNEFKAGVEIHNAGTIPVHVSVGAWEFLTGDTEFEDDTTITFEYWYLDADDGWVDVTDEVDDDGYYQLEPCHYLRIVVVVYLEQNPDLEGEEFTFKFDIDAIQWHDPPHDP